jgi:transposase
MMQLATGTQVWISCRPTDMRKGFNGLAAEVKNVLSADPFSGHLFVFRGKRGDYIKALYWDGSGLCLFSKRLENGRFVWPPVINERLRLTSSQLAMLIEGMDWRRTVAIEVKNRPSVA